MKQGKKLLKGIGKHMALIVLVVAGLSLFVPSSALWIQTSWINYLLMVVMGGMGMTVKPRDFALVFQRPRDVFVGTLAQFSIMPLLALALSHLFGLDAALTAGMVLVGTCPGGTSSNVITFLAKGDVAYSISMTSVNTLLAPILTPAITYLLLHTTARVDVMAMVVGICQVVVLPIALGMLLQRLFPRATKKAAEILPEVSTLAICLIVGAVVSHNAERILASGLPLFAAVLLHNLFGYLCGFLLGMGLHMPMDKRKAISIEVGMQNSGLATSLAATAFTGLPMATVPGAVFSVLHNLTGALLAALYKRMGEGLGSRDGTD